MKPAHWIALAAFSFVTGAVVLGLNRGSVGASDDHRAADIPPAPAVSVSGASGDRGTAATSGVVATPAPVPSTAAEAEWNLQQGQAAVANGDYDLAMSYFTEALRLRPGYREALANRCVVKIGAGRSPDAVADADEVIRLATNDEERGGGFFLRGLANYHRNDGDAAVRDFSEALRLGINGARTYVGRGDAYRVKGDWDKAIADYSTAFRLDGNTASAFSGRGKAYSGKELWDRAIADFSHSIELKPDAEAYTLRSWCHVQKGNWSAAIRDGESALALDSKCASAHALLAETYTKLGDARTAAFHQQRYTELTRLQGQR